MQTFKCILYGDKQVGKKSLIQRLQGSETPFEYPATFTLPVDGQNIRFEVYRSEADCRGQMELFLCLV